ncbi:ACT domain-containing protein [Mesorhizobium sp. CC13]|uniref:ACT domain-containing protein n=1 Tax=Mesorhizobium sp. CC13 TaxID=3029194 RepID=UPI003267D2C2
MSGETDLQLLLASMAPHLAPDVYVFATVPRGTPMPAGVDAVMSFREAEGTTLILREEDARNAGVEAAFACRMVTLDIHSSLEAVGFLAAITTHLAAAGMGVNPVSAFYHDHLFVPAARADEAMVLLKQLAAEAARPHE